MTATFTARVADRALEVRPLRVVLSVLAAPFYALGWIVGIAVVGIVWCYAAAQVGWGDARRRPDDQAVTDAVG